MKMKRVGKHTMSQAAYDIFYTLFFKGTQDIRNWVTLDGVNELIKMGLARDDLQLKKLKLKSLNLTFEGNELAGKYFEERLSILEGLNTTNPKCPIVKGYMKELDGDVKPVYIWNIENDQEEPSDYYPCVESDDLVKLEWFNVKYAEPNEVYKLFNRLTIPNKLPKR